ncbi:hypothetical protein [Streptomyces sp. NBC_01518]
MGATSYRLASAFTAAPLAYASTMAVDDFRVHGRALSAAEVATLAQAPST